MTTLVPTSPWSISPVADSGTRCKKCSRWLTSQEGKTLRTDGRRVTCSCGAVLSSALFDTTLGIRGDNAQFCDASAVLGDTWYHATISQNWSEFIAQGQHMVHLGTKESALDLAKSYRHVQEPMYLYEVMLDAASPVAPEIFIDDDHWPSTPDQCIERFDVWSVFIDGINRYVNACEAPGSVSLLASTSYVRVLSRTQISAP